MSHIISDFLSGSEELENAYRCSGIAWKAKILANLIFEDADIIALITDLDVVVSSDLKTYTCSYNSQKLGRKCRLWKLALGKFSGGCVELEEH